MAKGAVKVVDLFGNVVEQKSDLVIPREDLARALVACFKGISLEDFIPYLTNPFLEIIEYARLCRGARTCMKTSLLFNPHRLTVICKNRGKNSVLSSLSDESWLSGLARACLAQARNGVSQHTLLFRSLCMGVNGTQIALEFPPYTARDICKMFGVKVGDWVLDPCAGWGGRMLGISSIGANYYACEPATQTHAGLLKLLAFIHQLKPDFRAKVHCLPYEDAELRSNHFDFAITSPPYYDTEHYADEPTNSWVRYDSFDSWCGGFYKPFIMKTIDALKPGKTFVVNIGDRQYPLSEALFKICGKRYRPRLLPRFITTVGLGKVPKEGEKFYAIRKPV